MMVVQIEIDELAAAGIEVTELEEFLSLNEIGSPEELERTILLLIEMNFELRGVRPS